MTLSDNYDRISTDFMSTQGKSDIDTVTAVTVIDQLF